jgi:hypothetical protein
MQGAGTFIGDAANAASQTGGPGVADCHDVLNDFARLKAEFAKTAPDSGL